MVRVSAVHAGYERYYQTKSVEDDKVDAGAASTY
jgi:hypothetical protein